MDSQSRDATRIGIGKGRLRYFYLNQELHKKIHINRGADLITTWNYPQCKQVGYSYASVRRNAEKAYTTKQAGLLLNRGRIVLENAILDGNVNPPQKTYGFEERTNGGYFQYMWSEDDVWSMHDYLSTVHKGRPRKDGLVTTHNLPSRAEVRARMRQETVLYVKNDKGEFVPTWQAEHF